MSTEFDFVIFALSSAAVIADTAQGVVIATSMGVGADAEVRDHQPTTNFGASTELGTRIVDNLPFGNANDGNDRFSAMYLKFDIAGQSSLPNPTASVRLTYRNTNLTPNRLHERRRQATILTTGLASRSTASIATTLETTGTKRQSRT